MTHDGQNRLAAVAAETPPKQAEDIHDRWWWVEHAVWTKRMLERLEQSEPATKWFGLWDKVWAERNLLHGCYAVWRNNGAAGVDKQTVTQFEAQEQLEITRLREELQSGRYRPRPARRVWIPKMGSPEKRPLGIPAVRDRVVQAALRNLLEPIFEQDFAACSYGFRPGMGCREAVAAVEQSLEQGHVWCVDADLKSYFDTIPHSRLMELIGKRIVDGSVLRLIEQYLKAGVMEQMKEWQPTTQGTPQGAVISPLLANIYLNPLDHQMAGKGWKMTRYADDFVVLCQSEEEAKRVLEYLRAWTAEAGLTLHPVKTRIVNASTEGFDFLGWTFRGGKKWPRKKRVLKLRETLRPWTGRSSGLSLNMIVAKMNPTLRGWRGYFGASTRTNLRDVDGWLRRRLRAMLRRRERRQAFGLTPADHQRWPNCWFAKQGLYSLEYGTCEYI
jgi:RNA-directed DNA polymerase